LALPTLPLERDGTDADCGDQDQRGQHVPVLRPGARVQPEVKVDFAAARGRLMPAMVRARRPRHKRRCFDLETVSAAQGTAPPISDEIDGSAEVTSLFDL
jgi:hypothetical protein